MDTKLHSIDKITSDKCFDIKLKLSAKDISRLLDDCLGERIVQADEELDDLLDIAERIKPEQLTEEFCRYFSAELQSLLRSLISDNNDSYQLANFQNRMLRKFIQPHVINHKRSA